MNLKIDITKKLLLKLAMIIVVISAAVLLDVYFDNNPAELENIQAESEKPSTEPGGVYLIAQTSSTGIKTSVQKFSSRKLKVQSHDKFLRSYHRTRNNQIIKAEVQTQTVPLIQSYHYLVFQNYFFTQPDEAPLA